MLVVIQIEAAGMSFCDRRKRKTLCSESRLLCYLCYLGRGGCKESYIWPAFYPGVFIEEIVGELTKTINSFSCQRRHLLLLYHHACKLFSYKRGLGCFSSGLRFWSNPKCRLRQGLPDGMFVIILAVVRARAHTMTQIGSAVSAAIEGDTIFVNPGVYREQVIIEKNNITLKGFTFPSESPFENSVELIHALYASDGVGGQGSGK